MRTLIAILLIVGICLISLGAVAQTEGGAVNIAFVFDASGSMGAAMEGRTRLAVAQDAMSEMVADLPAGTAASLWVYGHRLSQDDPAASCEDIEEVIPLEPVDAAVFEEAVRGLNAIGYTPITSSIQLAAQTLLDQPDARNTIVLISDGEETCGGQPCLMAQALKQANIELTINTIGFAPNDETRQQLECIADVTGGTYYEADDAQQLTEALQSAVAEPGMVQLTDIAGVPLANVPFTVQALPDGESRPFTGSTSLPAGEYRVVVTGEAPLDTTITVRSGETLTIALDIIETGTLQLVDTEGALLIDQAFVATNTSTGEQVTGAGFLELPRGTYSVQVSTEPPLIVEAYVYANEVTDVEVGAPTGTVRAVDESGLPLENQVFDLIAAEDGLTFTTTGTTLALPGAYTAVVYTDIPFRVELEVVAGEVTDIVVPATGLVRVVDAQGQALENMVFALTSLDTGAVTTEYGEINVPPGPYRAEIFTDIPFTVEIEVVAGEVTELVVAATGTVRVVDDVGEALPGMFFELTPAEAGEMIPAVGEIDVPPGRYDARVYTEIPFNVEIEVVAGEVTDLTVGVMGTLQMVDEQGDVVADMLFSITPADGGEGTTVLGSVEVPPGLYRVQVFAVFPYLVTVQVLAGETSEVVIEATGTIQVVNARGNIQASALFTAERLEDGASVSALGTVEVPPGVYLVTVLQGAPVTSEVEVVAGENTTVNLTTGATNRPAP